MNVTDHCWLIGGMREGISDIQFQEFRPLQADSSTLLHLIASSTHSSTQRFLPLACIGKEDNYLRAQIARIACTTVCCPQGLFTADEEGTLEKNEEWEGLPGKEAATAGAWAHRYPLLKKQGRCALYAREPPEDEEEEFELTEEEQEEGPEALGALEEDTPLADGETPAWSPLISSSSENVKFQVGGLRSNLWPGAFVVAKDKSFSNVYVGWGVKAAPFVPLPPPPVAKEFDQALVESLELPPKPVPPPPEGEEGEEQ